MDRKAIIHFQNLNAGNYTVTVEDDNCSQQESFTVGSQVETINLTSNTTYPSCNGNDGVIELIPSGGTTPYSFQVGNNSQSNPVFTGLSSGTYTCKVVDASGCSESINVTLQEPEQPVLEFQKTDASCGLDNGRIELSASGGTAPYTYYLGRYRIVNWRILRVVIRRLCCQSCGCEWM